ncbi:hypothetical protein LCGC14_0652600 [marine sediment metagenome]|uniref:Major facilitator superfamily (MFS) profile domain-containing protein n=1 Tax=marine sediment metagenome TaxID=412755 RepID=A0A0F9U4A8_9ZZZZ
MIISKKSIILILISVLITNTVGLGTITYFAKYLDYLDTKRALIQLIVSITPLTAFIFPLLFGFFSDKIQNRSLFLIFGTIGLSFSSLMLLSTQNLIVIIMLLFLFGASMASTNLSLALYVELVEDDQKLISYFNAVTVAGWFLGSQFGGIFIDVYGIDKIFLFGLLVSLPNIIIVVFIKEHRSLILERYNSEVDLNKNGLNTSILEEEGLISFSIYPSLFLRNFSIKSILPILVIIMGFYISGVTEIGFLMGVNFLFQFFQMLLMGKVIKNTNIKSFIIIGYLLSAISVFGYIISTNFWSFLFFQLLVSFSYSMHWAAILQYIAQNTTPENKARYMSYVNASVFSGSFVGGLFFALLLFFNPDYYVAMYFLIIFPVISTFIILFKFKSNEKIIRNSKKDINSEL